MSGIVRRLSAGLVISVLGVASVVAQTTPNQQPANQAPASGAGTLKVAFVRAQSLLRGMPGYTKAESLWTKEAELAKAEADKMQTAWDSTVAVYNQSKAMLSASARTAREKTLQAQQDSLRSKAQTLQEKVDARERELLTPMQTRLQAIIDGIRAEGNYLFVIDLDNPYSQNIVSYDKSADITDRVVRRLQQNN